MYRKLFEPINIGRNIVKNRFVMPAMHSTFVSEFGAVTKRLIDYYVARARGGVGLIVVENTCIDWPIAKVSPTVLRIDDDKFIYGLSELAEAIHLYDVVAMIQLHHVGRQTTLSNTEGLQPVAPSAIPVEEEALYAPEGYPIPRVLTIEEIERIEDKFMQAAVRARKAGFDGIELHGAHGYIFSQFFSPKTNKRNDLYGGSLRNRARFAIEVVEKIKEKLKDFPVIFKFSADEYVEGGATLEDSKKLVQWLEEAGVDAFCVSAGTYESRYWSQPCYDMPYGVLLPLAEEIKKVVNVPVIAVGKMTLELAEKAIEEGKCDMVAFGRPLLADPELPKKAFEGKLDDIRPCIYCNEGCQGRQWLNLYLSCDVNYEHGREELAKIQPVERPKKVLIVGGGPAGLEAARVAALRGHEVVLYEKNDKLGGNWIVASMPHFKESYRALLRYLVNQVNKLNVKIELNRDVTPAFLKEKGGDVVIIATGAIPLIPDIPGINLEKVVTADKVILGAKEVGEKIAIIGGGRVGCETAWFLAEKGKKVTIIEIQKYLVSDLNPVNRDYILKKLRELNVNAFTETHTREITEEGVIVINKAGNKCLIEADDVVLAVGYKPNNKLVKELQGQVGLLYAIGDCVKPRSVREAIHEGSRVAREI